MMPRVEHGKFQFLSLSLKRNAAYLKKSYYG